eukprot:TRINITY_DN492_c0_g1_i1.p1 TRINITY_DN492_c0_g1~~TRINITY_DN492_c0_g1_i1.p1  ORF type:complete len:439 (+),score=54.56 TRINITY_DN492_c0_g1_i1:359-1675(+)
MMKVSSVFLLLLSIACIVQCEKVAIVGAGIGGGATSYYLNEKSVVHTIDVFERNNYIGGRLKHVTVDHVVCEVGGDAWSSVNEYLMRIKDDLKIKMENNSYNGKIKIGYYEGDGIWYEPHDFFFDDVKLVEQVELFRARLRENYMIREFQPPFQSVDEFALPGGIGKYYASVNTSTFMKEHGISYDFVWADVIPITHVIYDQGDGISAFAGIVSVVPTLTAAYSVRGGNSLIVEAMLNHAKANVHLNTPVQAITNSGGKYYITANSTSFGPYDSVVVATPIEFINAAFNNVTLPEITAREFVSWHVTLVSANAFNPTYFKENKRFDMPNVILTTPNSTAPFTIIQPQYSAPNGNIIWKIFSNTDVSGIIDQIFDVVTDSYVQVWNFTFPHLEPPPSYQPIILSPSLYYINTLESLASAMETSTIGGRNIAQIINKKGK